MEKVELNQLPEFSVWPFHLLNLSGETQARTISKVTEEYDEQKFPELLSVYEKSKGTITPEQLILIGLKDRNCVSIKDELVIMSPKKLISCRDKLILGEIKKELARSRVVVELGCGYGYNLWRLWQRFPDKTYRGAELSDKARTLAGQLFNDNSHIKVTKFNFYDSAYKALEQIEDPFLLLTIHAIEQIPCCSHVFKTLSQYREKITSVFHFEPLYELYDESLLGFMRRRYCEVNDYNRDLFSQLKENNEDIEIMNLDLNIFGRNPLFPISMIHWKFR